MSTKHVAGAAALFIVGALLGYVAGRHVQQSGTRPQGAADQQQKRTKTGSWSVKFSGAASFRLPEKEPIVRLDVKQHKPYLLDALILSATNLTDRSYVVSYNVYGYDSKGSRMSEGGDKFAIGRRESVIRQVDVEPYGGGFRKASSFQLVTTLEQ